MTESGVLAGRRILVTRPAGQAEGLIRRLEDAGAAVLHRPTLRILPLSPTADDFPARADWLVFTSPNAVRYGVEWLSASMWRSAHIAAVGAGTAAAIEQQGGSVDAVPAMGGGVDDLLAEADFDPGEGASVLIIRGENGRQRLQTALQARGARVYEAAVYRRIHAASQLNIPREWQAQPLDCTIVTSVAGLSSLLGMAGASALEWLLASRLVTVSARIATAATTAGFEGPAVASGANDSAITRAVCAALQREI